MLALSQEAGVLDIVRGLAVVFGVAAGAYLVCGGVWYALAAMGLAYALVMHCPPFDLVGELIERRRRTRDGWVEVERRTTTNHWLTEPQPLPTSLPQP